MSENLKTEWESLRNGERTEIGLVQVDIEGHSKIKANERNLKKAKDIFSDEIERIAVAHGGKLFKWEGDGGSYMFLMRDGENFNRLVKAALVMLESMPAINKKIADETDLKDPIRVRLSCDSGVAEFDKNPTRIAADFINSFIKNERNISLPDNVCITESVYKQLDAQLRARFSFYKHSHEIRSDIYSLPRPKSPLRWKHVALLLLLGIVLGLLCAAILAYFGWLFSFREANTGTVQPQNIPALVMTPPGGEEEKTVYMLGSGTVYRYLTEAQLFENLRKDGKNVPVLEGPTDAGIRFFASTSNPSTAPSTSPPTRVLVMASEKQPPHILRQYQKQPGAIYEIYLGADPLEVLYAAGGERRLDPSETDNFFLVKGQRLTFGKLREKWGDRENIVYDIYAGQAGSGTRNRWEKHLFGDNKRDWPSSPVAWDIRIFQILEWTQNTKPRIHLGSEVLNADQEKIIRNNSGIPIPYNRLTIFDDGEQVKRGLYLYGWMEASSVYGNNGRYYLPKPVVETLEYVFNSLEGQKQYLDKYLDRSCIDKQREYFHLKPYNKEGEGWVSINLPGNEKLYRPESCKGRVEE